MEIEDEIGRYVMALGKVRIARYIELRPPSNQLSAAVNLCHVRRCFPRFSFAGCSLLLFSLQPTLPLNCAFMAAIAMTAATPDLQSAGPESCCSRH